MDTIRASDAPGPGSSPGGHTKKRTHVHWYGRLFFCFPTKQGEKPEGSENRLSIFFRKAKSRRTHQKTNARTLIRAFVFLLSDETGRETGGFGKSSGDFLSRSEAPADTPKNERTYIGTGVCFLAFRRNRARSRRVRKIAYSRVTIFRIRSRFVVFRVFVPYLLSVRSAPLQTLSQGHLFYWFTHAEVGPHILVLFAHPYIICAPIYNIFINTTLLFCEQ